MATSTIAINSSTWTQVLSGEGFAICSAMVRYSFHATAPAASFEVKGGNQVNGATGQILWAKSIGATAGVSSSPSA